MPISDQALRSRLASLEHARFLAIVERLLEASPELVVSWTE